MATPFKSMGKKRALLIAIRNVLGSEYSDLPTLSFAHRDARELRSHLIESNGYHPEDVILMIDDRDHPRDLWPTHHKILHQIDQLTYDVPEDCHFFFYYSGHGLEEKCCGRTSMRPDGMDDEIVSADGKPILDYILHDRLITPLERVKGSTLFALFDCCHSETLLDLRRGKGPNCYSREWNIGRDQFFRAVAISIYSFLKLNRDHYQDGVLRRKRRSTYWEGQPASKIHEVGELSAICLSACRDGQLAHDDRQREITFSKCFMEAMAQKPTMSWTELRDTLKELVLQIHERYKEMCWVQEPRLAANSSADLTKRVTV